MNEIRTEIVIYWDMYGRYLRLRGVELEIIDDKECRMVKKDFRKNPDLWRYGKRYLKL